MWVLSRHLVPSTNSGDTNNIVGEGQSRWCNHLQTCSSSLFLILSIRIPFSFPTHLSFQQSPQHLCSDALFCTHAYPPSQIRQMRVGERTCLPQPTLQFHSTSQRSDHVVVNALVSVTGSSEVSRTRCGYSSNVDQCRVFCCFRLWNEEIRISP